MRPTHFFAATDIVVIDYNPENADIDNRRGEVYGYAAHCYAEDAVGNRVRVHVATSRWENDCLPSATRLAEALNARLRNGKLPVRFELWEQARPAYGSDAYIEYGQQDDLEWEKSCECEF